MRLQNYIYINTNAHSILKWIEFEDYDNGHELLVTRDQDHSCSNMFSFSKNWHLVNMNAIGSIKIREQLYKLTLSDSSEILGDKAVIVNRLFSRLAFRPLFSLECHSQAFKMPTHEQTNKTVSNKMRTRTNAINLFNLN